MHSISYEVGKVIYGCRRPPWGINGHEDKNKFIKVFTGRVTQNIGYDGYNVLAPFREDIKDMYKEIKMRNERLKAQTYAQYL